MNQSARGWTEFVVFQLLFLVPYMSMMYALEKGLVPGVKPGDPTFILGFVLGYAAFLCAVLLSRLSRRISSLIAGRQRFDLCSIESLSEKDPGRRKLLTMLLRAIRDCETRLRLEPLRQYCRAYGTDNDVEKELVPLEREMGSKVITAMKIFAGQNAAGRSDAGVQAIPVLVGGNPVTLYLQSLPGVEEEELSIGIEDPGLHEANNSSEAVTCRVGRRRHCLQDWIAQCEGTQYVDELRREMGEWAEKNGVVLDEPRTMGPGARAKGDADMPLESRETPDEAR